MERAQRLRNLRCLAILLASGLLCVSAQAQVKFVQITDPHIFDDGENMPRDKEALAAAIKKINERMDEGAAYNFVVLTGDLGIEGLIGDLDGKDKDYDKKVKERIQRGAAELAEILARSKVNVWLFVPGNNDLLKELPDNIAHYHSFIEELKAKLGGMKIIDLCPRDEAKSEGGYYSRPAVHNVGAYAFVGFDDTSFKNDDCNDNKEDCKKNHDSVPDLDPKRLKSNSQRQWEYVSSIKDLIDGPSLKNAYVYVFYHIPEVDDPYLASLDCGLNRLEIRCKQENKLLTGEGYVHSAWFVDSCVRDKWNEVVKSENVKGLFAGHFHESNREAYRGVHWMRSPAYLSGSLAKLYVCPPLANKLQGGKESQARGIQEVSIDGRGRIIDENGRPGVRIFWYDQSLRAFDDGTDKKEISALNQMRLGEIHEGNDQFKDAEAAFIKAYDSDSPMTRGAALASLRRVQGKQASAWNYYIFGPLGLSLSPKVASLLTLVVSLYVLLLLWWLLRRQNRNRLEILPIVDSSQNKLGSNFGEILATTLEMMRLHFKQRGPMRAGATLPVTAKSQTSEIADLAASFAPSGWGKAIAWVTRLANRPEYSIRGSLQSSGSDISIIVRLDRDGEVLGIWDETIAATGLFEKEKDLAYKVLIFLKEYIEHEHAR
ncbi:MAG TPA: metallophosphoesterase [Blastocatellia bacterium]|nr:metallophosphoesterase [Blastocatellia bacterium]